MVSRDGALKVLLVFVLVVLVFDKLYSGGYFEKEHPTYGEGGNMHVIQNAVPHDLSQRNSVTWNVFNPVLHALWKWQSQEDSSESQNTVPSFMHKVKGWLQQAFSMFSKSPNSNATLTELNYANERAEVEIQALQNSKAYHNTQIDGTDVAYHNPFRVMQVRGVALLIHGCAQEASDWFRLPEHRHITAQLVRKRLAIFAVTSGNRISGCWSTRFPYWQNEDVRRVITATKQWMNDQRLSPKTPLYAIGISSGATMLSVLSTSPELPRLASQALYISPGNQRALHNASESYPHTLFVHVATDHQYASASAITQARNTLLARQVGLVGELTLPRMHFTPLTIHEREPKIPLELSRKIFAAAEIERGDIERAMRLSTDGDLVPLWTERESRRALQQVARVLNGFHEVSAVHADKVVEWLITHGRRLT